jgi:hypothetical protein
MKRLSIEAGCHLFSVLGTDGKGNIRPSNPVLVIVWKLAENAKSPRVEPKKNEPVTAGKLIYRNNTIGFRVVMLLP